MRARSYLFHISFAFDLYVNISAVDFFFHRNYFIFQNEEYMILFIHIHAKKVWVKNKEFVIASNGNIFIITKKKLY